MTNVVPYQSPAPAAVGMPMLLPANMGEAMRLAEMMSTARLVPAHLQKSPADCLMVVQQAIRWRMDPFAVAQATAVIQGKLMYEGKLVAAVVNSLGNLSKRLSYRYDGEGNDRVVTVSGTLVGETDPLIVYVRLEHARTNNKVWQTQPDQQLAYHGARVWARRYMPELMLGVYTPEEFDAAPMRDVTPPAPAPQIEQVSESPKPAAAAKPPLMVNLPDGWAPAKFPRTKTGLREALEFMAAAVLDGSAVVVPMNEDLLTTIEAAMPALAEQVALLRAAADDALLSDPAAIEADDMDDEAFPGDLPSRAEPGA